MKIKKIFNNNVLLAEQDHHEAVLIGKGLAFQKKAGQEVDETKVSKIYAPTEEKWLGIFRDLMQDISPEYFEVSSQIIEYAEQLLNTKFNEYLLIALTDHIHFAIVRQKKKIVIHNEMLWEIQRIYQQEYLVGQRALEIIQQTFNIQLPDDEAGFIAFKFVENSMGRGNEDETLAMTKLINDVLNIVKYQLKIDFKTESISYQRFLVHLRFFAERITKKGPVVDKTDDDHFLFDHIAQKYPDAFTCVEKIKAFIEQSMNETISMNEQVYLTMHIQRVVDEG
ncbi:transcriptional antiterminator [Loigolactobacillus backii]|uniref:Transcriptional antiterminator n=2 Tax=Loigolactobacillus backii TaxID=375175 RepID=A0A192GZZ0_9LACO|nr:MULTISPECIES: PRD domain-containing protein [Loigolactobacillus]ANK60759.1 transcriptional antiterminator [Loigolactobacillus backii]ANK61670.1 transcriptional antiterminator [Loigolactobacillus backii]ANK65713.1 transcriptional antiterminator [Loigolactobacillus backii]ANK68190.1 transcriptional antiterminator [Loigolactobacillus backii]ANK69131.1 transcriptional antiterminator [Loigolactobacillus backii]